jgi:cytochrome c oxidase subunit 2
MASKKAINSTILGLILAVVVVGYVMMNYSPVGSTAVEDKEFDVLAFQWGFEPQFIEVNKGDHVVLKVTSDDVAHGLAIDEYQINEAILPGETVEIEFIADKTGSFKFYCSLVCGAGHDQQHGSIIVKDPLEPEPEVTILTAIKTQEKIVVDGIIDNIWNDASESTFTTVFVEEGRQIKVKSLTDGNDIFFLLRWNDDDANDDGTTETDRIAIGFDISGNSDIAMGAAGVPHVKEVQRTIGEGTVDIWHWKAFDGTTKSTIDDEFAGPFEQLKEHYYRDDDDKHGGQNDIIAKGSYDVETKEWIVEITRSLITDDTDVEGFGVIDKQFESGKDYKISFAVWDGGQGETAGNHRVTDWGLLIIE